ncbi:hypothetical protein BCR34DRAFT_601177 [Clohesyomyces aquaticus]|uniref:DUF7730 domain-containing protein n=1 Tax=Clohesyomyces aquaticus TaxID=1231657 RepID=A0A1Y1ZNB1_9PLEO|nr:hypothetical protein BCR34DRAFT_601177 [Clohesyomyces aquaticus]
MDHQTVSGKMEQYLSLPFDIRHLVYKELLVGLEPIHIICEYGELDSDDESDEPPLQHKAIFASTGMVRLPTEILLTSKLVAQEAVKVLYSENTFVLRDPNIALGWLRKIGSENISMLRSLVIRVELNSWGVYDGLWGFDFTNGEVLCDVRETAEYCKKEDVDPWVEIFKFLAEHAKGLKKLVVSFEKYGRELDAIWFWEKPLFAMSWALQIECIKALASIQGLTCLEIRDSFPGPIPAYLEKKMGVKVHVADDATPYFWGLKKLTDRAKRELKVLNLPKEEMVSMLQNGDRSIELLSSNQENLELDKGSGFFYHCYEDVEEALPFQQKLDEMGIKEEEAPIGDE